MNDRIDHDTLDAMLDALVASEAGPHGPLLDDWIRRYPDYAQELTEFAAGWSLMRSLPPAPGTREVSEETLVRRGLGIVHDLLARQERAASIEPPIAGLLEAGRARGLAPRQLAQATGLGDSLLRKLDRRLIRYASIPREAIEAIATALQREIETVARYLQQGPTFAAAARHRAEQAPQLAEPEDFFSAVRADPTLGEDRREHWLALAPGTPARDTQP